LHLASGLAVARLLGKPPIVKIGGSNVIPLMATSIVGRLELWMSKRWAHRLMILNDGMREEALAHGFREEQLLWMPNPVDTAKFAPPLPSEQQRRKRHAGLSDTAPVILYTGRLAPEKGLPHLLHAFAKVAAACADATLALVGDGPEREALTGQAQRLGIYDRVRFIGRVAPSEVAAWLQLADVFALVSPSEGFSCSLSEAMSVGVPAVVTDIPANRQLVSDGEQGRLVPYGDAEAIADAILEIVHDSAKRRRMGDSARQLVIERFGIASVGDRYEELFHSALAAS
jgi:glycosyltransferase involved in cell wall biosynthesis